MDTLDNPMDQRPGEKYSEYLKRLEEASKRKAERDPGGYMSTRNADGSSRGGAAEMFENYGFF